VLYTNPEHKDPLYKLPYFPLDGRLPPAPGPNTYGQSKEFAERMLAHLVAAHPRLAATSLRYPMLVNDAAISRFESVRALGPHWFNFAECASHLTYEDAGELIARVVGRSAPGYRQYFPALAMTFRGRTNADLIRQFYPDTPLSVPAEQLEELIDISEITRDTGWNPTRRIVVPLED
jgi:nucleoside-diphosphate-sugar epimerase